VIKEYLESVSVKKSNIKFIYVKEDMSHIFEINQALSNNELICFTGDRYFEGSKYLEAELLGKSAKFPAGPFLIASRLGVPVVYVYVMKEKIFIIICMQEWLRILKTVIHRDFYNLMFRILKPW
jgi:predicted LPLAT superfamily acyltransferase